MGSANSYTPDSSNSDTAPWQANLVESGIHNGGHQQPFFQIVASNNTQNILFDPRIRNNFNSPSLEVMRKMGTNQVLSMYQHNESHHSTQSNSAQVDPDPFVAMQNMLTRQHVGKTMSRECTPCATTSSLNSKTDGRIYQPSPTNQIFQDRPNEESSLVRKGAQIVTSNEDMQIRVYIGSNTSTQMQTSQHLHNGEVKRVENRLLSKESNQDGSNSANTCQTTQNNVCQGVLIDGLTMSSYCKPTHKTIISNKTNTSNFKVSNISLSNTVNTPQDKISIIGRKRVLPTCKQIDKQYVQRVEKPCNPCINKDAWLHTSVFIIAGNYVNQIGCVNTFEEDEKDLYSVMVVLDKCQTVVNCSTGELIQIEEKHELE